MDDSKIQENSPPLTDEILGIDFQSNLKSRKLFTDLVKSFLLKGADKVLMTRKSPPTLFQFDSEPQKVSGRNSKISESKRIHDYIDVSNVVRSPSGGYNEFPLNIITVFALILLKLIAFQANLFVTFFLFPIRLSYFSIMFLLFPFQTLSRIRDYLIKKMLTMWVSFYMTVTSFICNKFKTQKCVVHLAIRFGWAVFWSVYVWFLLVGLLFSGFIIGSLMMRRLVEEPIQRTETLNFDYTKASPVAFVPIISSKGLGDFNGLVFKGNVEGGDEVYKGSIPYGHKLQVSVSLTVPESEYNRKLGVFQVRVEFLSPTGKVTASSSYPCMLRYKSQSIRFTETMLHSIPLVTGIQPQTQILNVEFSDFTEGFEPTACLRVILEQRAEYKAGAGLPELYSASIALESELPRFKRIVWLWRRTIFVWFSLIMFLMELMVVLIFCRPIVLPKGRTLVLLGGDRKKVKQNKISW